MLERLVASIRHDQSLGVPAVRELPGGKYEVCDGNHRLEAIKVIGQLSVTVEDFGPLTDAEAVLLAQRRNHQWFENDEAALASLFKNVVLPEFSLDVLEPFMPLSRASMESLSKLTEFNWDGMPPASEPGFSIPMTDEIKELWPRWMVIAAEHIGDSPSKVDAFEMLLRVGVKALEPKVEVEL